MSIDEKALQSAADSLAGHIYLAPANLKHFAKVAIEAYEAANEQPVPASLVKCYAAFKTKRSLLYMPDGTTVEDIDWKEGIKAVLEAAGVKYVD